VRFLADAHISIEMVAMLRGLGHDCLDALAMPPRMADVDVLHMAANDQRVVLTWDKDFGELVFLHAIACPGVALIRVSLPNDTERVAHVRSGLAGRPVPSAGIIRDNYEQRRPSQAAPVTATVVIESHRLRLRAVHTGRRIRRSGPGRGGTP
jgi:predicted nuclease of predicted toxin-antitoxin system